MPSTSRRFRGKVKNREWALKQRNNPLRSLQERKRWMMEKAQAEGEGEGEGESLPPSLSTEEDQRFVLCITMDIRSPILMSRVWCSIHRADIFWVNKWSLHGIHWILFAPRYSTLAQLSAVTAFMEIKNSKSGLCKTKDAWNFYQCEWRTWLLSFPQLLPVHHQLLLQFY